MSVIIIIINIIRSVLLSGIEDKSKTVSFNWSRLLCCGNLCHLRRWRGRVKPLTITSTMIIIILMTPRVHQTYKIKLEKKDEYPSILSYHQSDVAVGACLFLSPAYGSMNTNRPWKCNIILRNVNLKWRFFIVKLRSANKLANSKTCINWFKVNLTFFFYFLSLLLYYYYHY